MRSNPGDKPASSRICLERENLITSDVARREPRRDSIQVDEGMLLPSENAASSTSGAGFEGRKAKTDYRSLGEFHRSRPETAYSLQRDKAIISAELVVEVDN